MNDADIAARIAARIAAARPRHRGGGAGASGGVYVMTRAEARFVFGRRAADRAIRTGRVLLPKAPDSRLIREPWAPRRRTRRPCRR